MAMALPAVVDVTVTTTHTTQFNSMLADTTVMALRENFAWNAQVPGQTREFRIKKYFVDNLVGRNNHALGQLADFHVIPKRNGTWSEATILSFVQLILGRDLDLNPAHEDRQVLERFMEKFMRERDKRHFPALPMWKIFEFQKDGETWRCLEFQHVNKPSPFTEQQYCDQAGVCGRHVVLIDEFVRAEITFDYHDKTVVRFSHYSALIVQPANIPAIFTRNLGLFSPSTAPYPTCQYKLHMPIVETVDGNTVTRMNTFYRTTQSVGQDASALAQEEP